MVEKYFSFHFIEWPIFVNDGVATKKYFSCNPSCRVTQHSPFWSTSHLSKCTNCWRSPFTVLQKDTNYARLQYLLMLISFCSGSHSKIEETLVWGDSHRCSITDSLPLHFSINTSWFPDRVTWQVMYDQRQHFRWPLLPRWGGTWAITTLWNSWPPSRGGHYGAKGNGANSPLMRKGLIIARLHKCW